MFIHHIKELVFAEINPKAFYAGKAMGKIPTIKNAWLYLKKDKIADFGSMDKIPNYYTNSINQIDASVDAPESITVLWENGVTSEVALSSESGKGKKVTAHYSTQSNLDSQVVDAVADIYEGWTGNFNLSHGPCGSIEVQKLTNPEDYPQDFDFNVSDNEFSLGHNQSETLLLNPGTYNVSEDTLDGWEVTAECVVNEEDSEDYTPGDDINLVAGDNVMCTFTNTFNASLLGDLVLWLNVSTLGLTNGDPVSLWSDDSSTGNDVAQGTLANQPEYVAGGFNSLPVVRFDGVNDSLENASPLLPSGNSDRTVFAVVDTTGDGTAGTVFDYGNNANGERLALVESDALTETSIAWWGHRWGISNFVTGPNLFTILIPSGSTLTDEAELYRDGSLLSSFSTSGSTQTLDTASSDLIVGGAINNIGNWEGDIAEILIYDRALSGAEQVAIEAYLSAKYGF